MKKLIYLIVLIVVLGLIVAGCIPVVPPAEQSNTDNLTKGTWNVVPGVDAIQTAIDQASDYDTIIVAAGTYKEQVNIEKPLTIVGAGQNNTCIVSPSPTDMTIYDQFGSKSATSRYIVHRGTNIPVVRIAASDVTFEGFHVDLDNQEFFDVQGSFGTDYSKGVGILVDHVETTFGIPIEFTGITIQDNKIDGLLWDDYSDGIKVMAQATVNINDNTIYGYGESAISAQGMDSPRAAYYPTVTANNNILYGSSSSRSGNHYFFGIGFWSGATGSADGNIIYNAPNDNGYALNSWTPNPVSFTNNIITTDGGGVGGYGAQLYESSNLVFLSNDIEKQGLAGAIWDGNVTDPIVTITNNKIINCIDGFIGDGLTADTVTIHCNNFEGIADSHYALDMVGHGVSIWGSADTCTITADATHNWWGHATGPHHAVNNLSGQGGAVSDYVDYSNWAYIPDFCDCEAKTIGYWKNHPEWVEGILDVLGDEIVVGDKTVTDNLAELIFDKPNSKTYQMLAAQLLAAKLNVAQLSHFNPDYEFDCVDDEIIDADAILEDHEYYEKFATKLEKAEANSLKDVLDYFNNDGCGDYGCPCECY